MSSSSRSAVTGSERALSDELQSRWRLLLVAGVVIALMGLVAAVAPFLTGVSIASLVGILLVVGGALQLLGALRGEGWRQFVWQIVLGGLSLVAGITVFLNPLFGLATLTLLVIAYLIASGVVEVVMGLRLRGEPNWAWTIASGVVGILLGAMLWAGFPSTALWAVGVLFGVNLLLSGISMIALALGARGLSRATDTSTLGAGEV